MDQQEFELKFTIIGMDLDLFEKTLRTAGFDAQADTIESQVNSVDLDEVVGQSEEREELCQSFVVDTRTSSATKCANCQKEAWEHRHN
jgi:hypothetical protein